MASTFFSLAQMQNENKASSQEQILRSYSVWFKLYVTSCRSKQNQKKIDYSMELQASTSDFLNHVNVVCIGDS